LEHSVSKKSRIEIIPQETPAQTSFNFPPRVLTIEGTAHYLSATYGFVEALFREREVRSWIQGKRRVTDIRELDDYIERKKNKAQSPAA
jgi:hypothetical protein